jgi:hypothetical protein
MFFASDALADPTWKSAFLNVWTVTEPGTYLIAACLPALRPMVASISRRLHLTAISSNDPRGSQSPNSHKVRLSHMRNKSQTKRDTMSASNGHFARIEEPGRGDTMTDEQSLISEGGHSDTQPMVTGDLASGQLGISVTRNVDVVFSNRQPSSGPTNHW